MLFLLVCVAFVTNSAIQASTTVCPPGYKATAKRCFKYLNAKMTHTNAMETCAYYNEGKAIDIKSLTDDTIASAVMGPDASTESLWLSIADDDLDGIFKYPDESPTTKYTPWDSTPDVSTQKACALRNRVNSVVTWYASNCTNTAKTICELPSIGKPCASGWVYNPDGDTSCLRPIRSVRRNYASASAYCRRLGGGLATHVTSHAQIKRVMKNIKFQDHFYIGIDDVDKDGTYKFKDGTNLTKYGLFKKGKPKPGRCVTIKKRRWYHKDCKQTLFFICEKKLLYKPNFKPVLDKVSPLTTPILGGNDPGKIIIVKGVSTANPERFSLVMLCGKMSSGGNWVMRFIVKFNPDYVLTQYRRDKKDSIAKKLKTDSPFAAEVPFEIMVLITSTSYKIAVNGQHFTEFPFPFEACADHLYMVGDVYVNEIRFL